MTRKIIAIFTALLLTASVAATVTACSKKGGGNTTSTGKVDIPSGSGENVETNVETRQDGTDESGNPIYVPSTEIGDPGEYSYTECDETVYVNNPGSEVTLRSAEYKAMGSVKHGTKLQRTGISTDEANYWTKVVYNGETYYMASKFITTMKDPTEGFESVEKTVRIDPKTGSLNIRNIPSMEGYIIGHAVSGVDIKVVGENTTTGWYKIQFINADNVQSTGYIASDAKYFEQSDAEESEAENDETAAGTEAGTASAGK